MKDPLISVLTATYNRSDVLGDAIESVLGQSYANFEHVIVDDGSDDQTKAVVKSYGDPRVRYCRTENQGQASALNRAISEARGEVVAFLDDDDTYASNHLSYLLSQLIGPPARDFILGRFELMLANSHQSAVVRDFYNPGKTINVADIEVITGVLFGRKKAFLDVGGFRSVVSADTDLFVRLKAAGCKWHRANLRTYKYHFGRTDRSQAIEDLKRGK